MSVRCVTSAIQTGQVPETYEEAMALVEELRAHNEQLRVECAGLERTVSLQAKDIGRVEKKLKALTEEDVELHPQRKEIIRLIDTWKDVTGHPKSKASKDRVDLVKARLKDGYSVEQLELAIVGLGATIHFSALDTLDFVGSQLPEYFALHQTPTSLGG